MIISTFFDNILSCMSQSSLTLEEVATRCIRLGVTGIDVEEIQISDPRLQILLDAGMVITSLIVRRDLLHSPSDIHADDIIRLAQQYKATRILLIPGYLSSDDDETTVMNAIAPLSRLCSLAEKESITVGVEDYDHEAVPTSTINGLSFFLDQIPGLSCFFDTGNFIFMAEDALNAYHLLNHRINSQIHCKDRSLVGRTGEIPSHSKGGLDLFPCAVGSGIIPIHDILCDLLKNGFNGVITAELFGSADTLGDLEKSAEFIKNCIESAM